MNSILRGLVILIALSIGYGFRARQASLVPAAPSTTPASGSLLPAQRLSKALTATTPADRLNELWSEASKATTTADWQALLHAASSDRAERDLILRRWVTADAQACWAYLSSQDESVLVELGSVAMKAWSALHPEEALAAASKVRGEGKIRDDFRWLALHAGLEQHPLERMKPLIEQLGDARSSRSNWQTRQWLQRDPEAAARYLITLPSFHRLRGEGFHALELWIDNAPDKALAWAEEQSAKVYGSALSHYLNIKLAAKSITPHEILDLALTTTSAKLRGTISSTALTDIVKSAPHQALEWAATHTPNSGIGSGLVSTIKTAHQEDPQIMQTIMSIVNDLPLSYVRASAAQSIARSEIYRDASQTLAWIDTLDPKSQELSFNSLALNFARSEQARAWLATASDSPFAAETLDYAITHLLAEGQQDIAQEWSNTLPKDRAAHVRERLTSSHTQ